MYTTRFSDGVAIENASDLRIVVDGELRGDLGGDLRVEHATDATRHTRTFADLQSTATSYLPHSANLLFICEHFLRDTATDEPLTSLYCTVLEYCNTE
jgi:hypothetical protein